MLNLGAKKTPSLAVVVGILVSAALAISVLSGLAASFQSTPVIAEKALCSGAPGQAGAPFWCDVSDPNYLQEDNSSTPTEAPLLSPLYYSIKLSNTNSANAQSITLYENLPSDFQVQDPGAPVACHDWPSGTPVAVSASGSPIQIDVTVPGVSEVVCVIPGYFSAGTPPASVQTNQISGDAQTSVSHEIANADPPLPTDLVLTKMVTPNYVDLSSTTGAPVSEVVTFELRLQAGDAVTLQDYVRIVDHVAPRQGSAPMNVALSSGALSCKVYDASNAQITGQDCFEVLIDHGPLDLWAGHTAEPFVLFGLAPGSSIDLPAGGSVVIRYDMEITYANAANCSLSPGGDGLENQAFLGLQGPNDVILDDDDSDNTTDKVTLEVHTGLQTPCDPSQAVNGPGPSGNPPLDAITIEKARWPGEFVGPLNFPSIWDTHVKQAEASPFLHEFFNPTFDWGINQPNSPSLDHAEYFIRISNTSTDTTVSGLRLSDLISNPAHTPPFTVQLIEAEWLNCPPGPPAPAPLMPPHPNCMQDGFLLGGQYGSYSPWSQTTQVPGLAFAQQGPHAALVPMSPGSPASFFPYSPPTPPNQGLDGYFDTAEIFSGGIGRLRPGESAVLRLVVNYSDPWCDSAPSQTPKHVDNIVTASFDARRTLPGGGVQIWSDSENVVRRDPIATPPACDFDVEKTVTGGLDADGGLVFGQPVTYTVEYTNDMSTAQHVGTVMDAVTISSPNYATQIPVDYSFSCSGAGVSNYVASSGGVQSGLAPFDPGPHGGLRIIQQPDGEWVLFEPGATLTCQVQLTVTEPAPTQPCTGVAGRLTNMALMDRSQYYNTNLPWPPSAQGATWDVAEADMPRCYDLTIEKKADVSSVGPNGGPITYTLTVRNNGGPLDLADFDTDGSGSPTYGPILNDIFTTQHPLQGQNLSITKEPCSAQSSSLACSIQTSPTGQLTGVEFSKLPTGPTSFTYTVSAPFLPTGSTMPPSITQICNTASIGMLFPVNSDEADGWYTPNDDPAAKQDNVCVAITGEIEIEKVVDYRPYGNQTPQAPLAGSTTATQQNGPFPMNVTCQDATGSQVFPPQGQQGQISVPANGSATLAGMPFESICTVTESLPPAQPGCWWSPEVVEYSDPSGALNSSLTGQYINVAASPNPVRVTNSYQCVPLVDVEIPKFLNDPDGVVPAGYTFDINLDCDLQGSPLTYTQTQSVQAGSSAVFTGVPEGSSCTFTETPPDSSVLPLACSFEQPSYTPPAPNQPGGAITAPHSGDIGVTNTVECGPARDVEIRKAFRVALDSAPGQWLNNNAWFNSYVDNVRPQVLFDVSCYDPATVPNPKPPSWTPPPPQWTGLSPTQTPAALNGVPVGWECAITETSQPAPPENCQWIPPSSQWVPTSSQTITIQGPQPGPQLYTFYNDLQCDLSEPALKIEKTVDQSAGGTCDDTDSCQFDIFVSNTASDSIDEFHGPLFILDLFVTGGADTWQDVTDYTGSAGPVPAWSCGGVAPYDPPQQPLFPPQPFPGGLACIDQPFLDGLAANTTRHELSLAFTDLILDDLDRPQVENCASLYGMHSLTPWVVHYLVEGLLAAGYASASNGLPGLQQALDAFANDRGLPQRMIGELTPDAGMAPYDASDPSTHAPAELSAYLDHLFPAGFDLVALSGVTAPPVTPDPYNSCAVAEFVPAFDIQKDDITPGGCTEGSQQACEFEITVENTASFTYDGPIEVTDALAFNQSGLGILDPPYTGDVLSVTGSPSTWDCQLSSGAQPVVCENDAVTLAPGGQTSFTVIMDLDAASWGDPGENCVEVTGPSVEAKSVTAPGPISGGEAVCEAFEQSDPAELVIEKLKLTPGACHGANIQGSANPNHCQFQITITNTSQTESYTGPLTFEDAAGSLPGKGVLDPALNILSSWPAHNGLVSSTGQTSGWTCQEQNAWPNIACDHPGLTLQPGGSETLTVTLDLNTPFPLTANCAELTTPAPVNGATSANDPDGPAISCAQIWDPTPPEPELTINKTKLTQGDCFTPGYACSFEIEILNHATTPYSGPVSIADAAGMANDPQILITQPSSSQPVVQVTGASPSGWTCAATGGLPAIECDHPNLTIPASSGGAPGVATLTLDTTMTNGDVLVANCAELTSPAVQGHQGPVANGPTSCALIGDPTADLSIEKDSSSTCPNANGVCDFTVTITNDSTTQTYTGPISFDDAMSIFSGADNLDPSKSGHGAGVNDLLYWGAPAGWTCQEQTAFPNIVCSTPSATLPPGGSVTIQLTLDDLENTMGLPATENCAELTAPAINGDPVSCVPVETAEPDIYVEKLTVGHNCHADGLTSPPVPMTCEFTLAVFNSGPGTHTGPLFVFDAAGTGNSPAMTTSLPPNWVTLAGYSAPQGWTCADTGSWPPIRCDHPNLTLPPYSKVQHITLEVAFNAPFLLDLNCAGAADDITNPTFANVGCDLLNDPNQPGPQLSIQKSQLNPGQCLGAGPNGQTECDFEITVTNLGATDYTGPLTIDDAAGDASVVDPFLSATNGVDMDLVSIDPGWTCSNTDPWALSCATSSFSVASGQSESVTLRVRFSGTPPEKNCARFSYPANIFDASGALHEPVSCVEPVQLSVQPDDGDQISGLLNTNEMTASELGAVTGVTAIEGLGDRSSETGTDTPAGGQASSGSGSGGSVTPQGPQLEIAKTKLSTWRCHGPALPDHPDPNVCVFEISVTNTGGQIYSGPVEVQDAAGEAGPGVFARPSAGVSLVEGPAAQSGWSCADRGTGLISCAARAIRLEPGATSRFQVTQRFDTPAPLAANCAALTGPLAGAAPACAPLEAELPEDPSACAQADGRWNGQSCSCPARHVFSQTWGRCTPLFCSPPMQLNEARSACVCPAGQALVNGQCRDTGPNIDRLIEIFAPVIGEGGGSDSRPDAPNRPDPGPACNPNGPVPC